MENKELLEEVKVEEKPYDPANYHRATLEEYGYIEVRESVETIEKMVEQVSEG